MKRNKLYTVVLTLLALFFTTSCDELLDVNTDPNNPATSTPQLTLPVAQVSLATVLESDYNILGSMLAHYWTTGPTAAQYSFIDKYDIRTTDFDNTWIFMYTTVLSDLEFVKQYGITHDQPNYAAIGQLLQAYCFQIMVDLYDKIPYTDALKGTSGNVSPEFENGDVVYDDLILKIDEALALIDRSASAITPGNDDLIFSGDMEMWQKFGNTLKLKIYIRQALVRPLVAEAGIEAMYADGAQFFGAGENAAVSFSANVHNENPFWQELNQTSLENLVASETSLTELNDNGDVRVTAFYDPSTVTNQYDGLPQGLGTQDGGLYTDYARPDYTTILNKEAPAYLMTGYESLFLQTEAALNGWSTGDAESLYNESVSESFTFWGLDASSYLATGEIYEFEGTLDQLYYQKWLAFNGEQGLEGWLEWRRTGVPELPVSVQGRPLANTYALRLIWPITERSANPNVPTITTVDTPVWWDTTLN
jgi:hypothetical protein